MFLKWRWPISPLLGALMVVGSVGVGSAAELACTSGDVACLISRIETANANGESNTITLEEGTYTLTTVNNDTEGPNGLPSITSALTIIGAGMEKTIIERKGSMDDGGVVSREAPLFRILHVEENGRLIIEDLTIQKGINEVVSGPVADGSGGGLSNNGETTVKNSAILNNEVNFGVGGGIYNRGTLSVLNSRIADNFAVLGNGGAGIYNDSEGIVTMIASWVLNNGAVNTNGGGIQNKGQATVTKSTISRNGSDGGEGILNDGTMTLEQSSITFNDIANGGTLTILNSTVSRGKNLIGGHGGFPNPSLTRIINSTVTAQTSGIFAAIRGPFNEEEGTVEVENTIVAGNETDCAGYVISLGHNLIGDPNHCSMVLVSSDEIGDPGLGDLVDDNTPGNGHFPLLPNSKAVDAGSNSVCPPTDQLGQTRPIDGDKNGTEDCDTGAFEFQAPITNQAPMVSAGGAQAITLPSAAFLDGAVSDDGLPNPPSSVTTTWTKVSGPGTVTFNNASSVDTTASFSLQGTYVLRLTADDGALSNSAEVTIMVNPAPPMNQPPNVHAGSDQTITLPSGATLDGTVMDNGLPSGTVTTTWTKVSGPGTVTFDNASSVDTTASFSEAGTYVLRLTANDGLLQVFDDMVISVTAAMLGDGFIAGIGDLDNNGTADVVWRNTTTGTVSVWFMNGLTVSSSTVLATIPTSWVIGGMGDLDNNGTADVLWRHLTTGTVAAWYMTSGTGTVARGEVLATGLPATWIIGGMGDLDNNGTADVVWRHVPSGLVAAWLMTPGAGAVGTIEVISTIPKGWIIGGMGDLNLGNGPADVVWHHPSSWLAAGWLMDGLTVDDLGIISAR